MFGGGVGSRVPGAVGRRRPTVTRPPGRPRRAPTGAAGATTDTTLSEDYIWKQKPKNTTFLT